MVDTPDSNDDTDIGYGVIFAKKVGNAGTDADYTPLALIAEFTPNELSRDSVEKTHMQSPDRYREFMPGLTDAGEFSFTYNLIPGGVDDATIAAHFAAHVVEKWRMTYPNGATLDVSAFATKHGHATPIDGKMTGSATFKISGKPVLTAAPAEGG